jgi:hypothetical protein
MPSTPRIGRYNVRGHLRHLPRSPSALAGIAPLASTGCPLLGGEATDATSASVHSIDPNVPFVVVTVGGSLAVTATPAVAETVPDSTPLPRIDLPTRRSA